MIQSVGFLGRLLGALLKNELPLKRNVLKRLVKSVLILLGLTAASAADPLILKKILTASLLGNMVASKGINRTGKGIISL